MRPCVVRDVTETAEESGSACGCENGAVRRHLSLQIRLRLTGIRPLNIAIKLLIGLRLQPVNQVRDQFLHVGKRISVRIGTTFRDRRDTGWELREHQ